VGMGKVVVASMVRWRRGGDEDGCGGRWLVAGRKSFGDGAGKMLEIVTNENDELVPTRTVTSWRLCIDYRKLNEATAKDHFPLPFMDQMRMPFGLYNSPTTFQRCMLAIFHDIIEEFVEVFMDDFSVFGDSFDKCLNNLGKMLQHCKDAHLVLNWEKCRFMVKEGIMLGHKVSGAGLEVDKAKINVISKVSPPTNIKGVRSFIGHVGFYRRFIKDFSKIAQLLTKLLEKDTPFEFDDECQKAFELLKEKLICAHVIISPNWNLSFELMCDASDFIVGAVLGQKDEIKDRKGTKNVAVDHLSQIKNDESSDDSEVDDNFPGETLMEFNTINEPCAYWALKNYNLNLIAASKKRMFQLHEIYELRHQAYENPRLYKARAKVWQDRKLRIRKEFKHGNKVLLFHSKYKFKQSKLSSLWLGPYIVKHQYPSEYIELYGKDGKTFIVNGLKLYHEEEDYNDHKEAVTPFFLKE
nr:reverse transcriptase domain-containing protein [Tanacetum cinerariifolium]